MRSIGLILLKVGVVMITKVPWVISDNVWKDFGVSLNSVFLLSNRLRGMVKIVWCLSESSHFVSWDSFHLSVLLKITVPFTFFLTNEVLVWTLMMCLTVTLCEGSIHVWESLVLQIKIISIWLLFVIWVPRWVFSLSKSSLNSWDSKLSVVPLA